MPDAVAPPPRSAECERVARERSDDAAAAGFRDDVQEKVRQQTYAACTEWNTSHPGS
jgi:hypothetical protein